MHAFTILSYLFAGITIVTADADSVNKQIQTIGDYTTLLNGDVEKAAPGIPGLPYALQVQQDAVNLHHQIIIGANEADASEPFGEPGSLEVSATLINISGTVTTTLQNTASKRTDYGDLGPIVLASLYQLKQDTNKLADAVVAKLAPLEKAAAPVVVGNLNSAFNNAIVAYGGKAT